jgi:hypothetical protein
MRSRGILVSSLLRKYGRRFAWARSGDQDLRLISREIVDR